MSVEKYELTEEHLAQLDPWTRKWTAVALSTHRMTDADKQEAAECVKALYTAAELAPPKKVLFSESPLTGAISATVAAGIAYLIKQPKQQQELFACDVTGEEFYSSMHDACYIAVITAQKRISELRGDDALLSSGMKVLEILDVPMEESTQKVFDEVLQLALSALSAVKELPPCEVKGDQESRVDRAPLTALLLTCCSRWYRAYRPGSDGAAWPAYLSFFRHVIKLDIDYSTWEPYERLAELAAGRFLCEDFAVLVERTVVRKYDENERLHSEDGPALGWSDSWEAYYWHGVLVPKSWIEQRDELTPQEVLAVSNVEQRRAGMEIIGWDKALENLGAKVINADPNPQIGTLLEVDLPDAPHSRFLRVVCGTGRVFTLPVPSEMKTALQANAWSYGVEEFVIKALQART